MMGVSLTKVALGRLPWPSTALTAEAVLCLDGGTLSLTFQADVDGSRRGADLVFAGVRAHAHRVEGACTAWHVTDAYDTVVEVVDSPWRDEIEQLARERGHPAWTLHHFMIYVDSHGAYEAIAASWSLRERSEPGD